MGCSYVWARIIKVCQPHLKSYTFILNWSLLHKQDGGTLFGENQKLLYAVLIYNHQHSETELAGSPEIERKRPSVPSNASLQLTRQRHTRPALHGRPPDSGAEVRRDASKLATRVTSRQSIPTTTSSAT